MNLLSEFTFEKEKYLVVKVTKTIITCKKILKKRKTGYSFYEGNFKFKVK